MGFSMKKYKKTNKCSAITKEVF